MASKHKIYRLFADRTYIEAIFSSSEHGLSSQPHRHKLFVAGNHDVLLDESFLETHPQRKYGQTKTMRDLDWGSVHYLRDSSLTLGFSSQEDGDDNIASDGDKSRVRTLTIYGSPWTLQYGISAFQYQREQDIWTDCMPSNTDIVVSVSHGPPHLHLDRSGFRRAGCPFMA